MGHELELGLISVIIPVYNVERYLACCLESVINNTYRDLEIICVNDGSTDGSLEILKQYAARDARIIVITQQNQGQSKARNIGIAHSRGEFIAFVDSDDYIHRRYFELLIQPMEDPEVCVSVAKYKSVYSNEESGTIPDTVYFSKINSIEAIFGNSNIRNIVWGRIYRKSFVGNERFTEDIKFEDKCFSCLLFAKHQQPVVSCSDIEVYYWHIVK